MAFAIADALVTSPKNVFSPTRCASAWQLWHSGSVYSSDTFKAIPLPFPALICAHSFGGYDQHLAHGREFMKSLCLSSRMRRGIPNFNRDLSILGICFPWKKGFKRV